MMQSYLYALGRCTTGGTTSPTLLAAGTIRQAVDKVLGSKRHQRAVLVID